MSRDPRSRWIFQYRRIGEPETLGQFADDAVGWLRKVRPLHPLFREADRLPRRPRQPQTLVSPDLSNLKDWILRHGWDNKADPRVFSALDAQSRPTVDATSKVGFDCSLWARLPSPKLSIHLFAIPKGTPGNDRGQGTVELLDAVANPSLLDPGFLTKLTEVTVEHYDPDSCCVFSLDFDHAIGHEFEPGRGMNDFLRIGWITYFGNPAVREVLPADIHAEPFGPGLLVMTQPTVPDLSRPEDIERGRRLVEALRESGWLKLSRMKRDAAT